MSCSGVFVVDEEPLWALKRGLRAMILAERRRLPEMGAALAGRHDLAVPRVFAVVRQGKRACLVMEFVPGRHLGEVDDPTIWQCAIEAAAILHAAFAVERPDDLAGHVAVRVAALHPPTKDARRLLLAFEPALRDMQLCQGARRLDCHADNWLVRSDGVLVSIDHEDRGTVATLHDIAALLIGRHDADGLLEHYWRTSPLRRHLPLRVAHRVFWNAIVLRAFGWIVTYAGRPGLDSRRPWAARQGLHAIDRLRVDHRAFAQRHAVAYAELEVWFRSVAEVPGPGVDPRRDLCTGGHRP